MKPKTWKFMEMAGNPNKVKYNNKMEEMWMEVEEWNKRCKETTKKRCFGNGKNYAK